MDDSGIIFCEAKIKEEFQQVFLLLEDAKKYYPDFHTWFYGKVIHDVPFGKRCILVAKQKERNREIVGISILKNDEEEKKICTFFVQPKYRKNGIGKKLMEQSLMRIQCKFPLLTVPEEIHEEFKTLLAEYKFKLTSVGKDMYRVGRKEYLYNA